MEKVRSILTTKNIITTLIVLLVVSTVSGVYFYQKATADPQIEAQKDLQKTIASVGNLMVLPSDETPTVATVSDPEKLKDQPFFAHAQKGDKVLVYTTSQKAILYSPSLNKIVEVAPINAGSTRSSANAQL